ncbi:MAG: hypothetical protein ABJE95_35375 [Byssovorax sp.]
MSGARVGVAPVAMALAFVAAACGGTATTTSTSSTSGTGGSAGTTSSTSGTGGAAPGKEPMAHRAGAAACTAARPAFDLGGADGKCLKDADCTAGKNGRCVAYLGKPSFCSYDACSIDADCGSAGVCDCRNGASFAANTCFHGNCQVDADCGVKGYCSPSAVGIGPDCNTGVQPGSYGYFCHTPADECTDDADCPAGMGQGACLLQPDKALWGCQVLSCTD